MKNILLINSFKKIFLLAFLLFVISLTNESCRKTNFNIPSCDSNCIKVNAIFFDSTLNKKFADKKLSVYSSRSTGVGMGFTKLWDIMTNSNGEANFDISFDKLRNNNDSSGRISFFICDKKYSDKGTTGNRVDLFIRESDIGQIVVKQFNLFKK